MKTTLNKLICGLTGFAMVSPAFAQLRTTIEGRTVELIEYTPRAFIPSAPGGDANNTEILRVEGLQRDGRESELNTDKLIGSSEAFQGVVLDPTGIPFVIAMYNPFTSIMRVDVIRGEKTGLRPQYFAGQFKPTHGDWWIVNKSYGTAGSHVNPFEQYRGPGDGRFHVVSVGGVQSAVARAMELTKAPLGVVGTGSFRMEYWSEKVGKKWSRKINYHYRAWGKIIWATITPSTISPAGFHSAICATYVEQPTTCPQDQRVPLTMRYLKQEGGTFPQDEEVLFHDIIQRKMNYFKIAAFAFAGALTGGAGYGALLAVVNGNAQQRNYVKQPGRPNSDYEKIAAANSVGTFREVDLLQKGETIENSRDDRYMSQSQGFPIPVSNEWETKAVNVIDAKFNNDPYSSSHMLAVRNMANLLSPGLYVTVSNTKKVNGEFNTGRSERESSTAVRGDTKYDNRSAGENSGTSSSQSKTKTTTNKGTDRDQRRAASGK